MSKARCAVAVLPGPDGDADRLICSVAAARAFGMGDFREIEILPVRDVTGRDALAEAASLAADQGFGWLLAVGSDEIVLPDIFAKAAPALRLHDAVWGAAGVARTDGTAPLERISRLAAQDLVTFFHCALHWWIGPSHFVRPRAALEALARAPGPDWTADYMLALWRGGRAYKTAQALTAFHGGLPPVPETARTRLLQELEIAPVFTEVSQKDCTVRLPYTGRNAGIERAHTRGQFFEHEELAFLGGRLPRGVRIVDAGANTGNHTLFFAAAMEAEIVHPIEPDGRAADAIRSAVTANGLTNVDLSHLGKAVGAATGRMRAVMSVGGGLGATRLVDDPQGSVPVRRIDDLIPERADLLKIDVEGMEMEVLAGAEGLIARHRPTLFVEVADRTTTDFLAWCDARSYRLEKLYPDKTHCNFFVVPSSR
jgi:FkbM family methyltransferase